MKALDERNVTKVDMKEFIDKVNITKIAPEVDNLLVASRFVKWTFDNIVKEVEDIIDAEKKIKHSQIQAKVERMVEKPEMISKFLNQFPEKSRPDASLLEYPMSVGSIVT